MHAHVYTFSLAAQSQDLHVLCLHVWLLLGQSGGRNLGVRLNNYAKYALDIVVREGVAERKSKLGWIQASREWEKGKSLTCGSSAGPVPPHCFYYLRCYFNQRFLSIIRLSPNDRWVRVEGPEIFAIFQPA